MHNVILALGMLAFGGYLSASTHKLKFTKNKTSWSKSHSKLTKMVKPVDVTIIEPHVGKKKTYKALDFKKVLSAVYGDSWKLADSLVFKCLDGFRPVVKTELLKSGRPFLAFKEKGTKDFKITKPKENNRVVELGPYYLIWDHRDASGKAAKVDFKETISWPYQLTGVEFSINTK